MVADLEHLETRAKTCTRHHDACSCREYRVQRRIAELEAEVERLEAMLFEQDGSRNDWPGGFSKW